MLTTRSRLRLVVIQVLILGLFGTLLARLWYIQVVAGGDYQQAAVSNIVRTVDIPAPRGLIVDSSGRPLVTNRTSWVVTVNRSVWEGLSDRTQHRALHRLSDRLGIPVKTLQRRMKVCGQEGAPPAPVCWNGSRYAPVPVATDVAESLAVSILEQPEDFPGITAAARKVRAYPSPMGANAAHLLGYLSPVTQDELEKAKKDHDTDLDAQSLVGRAGLEDSYDSYLRGTPGTRKVTVNSTGRVQSERVARRPRVGDTLVTSIDAKVQAVVEHQLKKAIMKARHTFDPVTGRNYVADSGSAVVLDPDTGRVIAMASFPTYDPKVWVGGISQSDLDRLYSKKAHMPLLNRATQGQYAPGSTWKPFSTAGALTHGYSPDTRLNCSSSFTVGNRTFDNYESEAYGMISFAQALQLSCDTFFYRIGYAMWLREGGNSGDVHAKQPLVANAKKFGFGHATGVDIPGEVSGRIADREWKLAYWKAHKDYYCKLGKSPKQDFLHRFAREFCTDGWRYRAGDAVNFVFGQGDTLVTPLQEAVAYAAIVNGGTLWQPRIGKAIVDRHGDVVKRIKPKASAVHVPDHVLHYIDQALLGTAKVGTMAWKMGGFPLQKVQVRAKTGTAEVHGKQTTSWLATYNKQYVVIMEISQGGTGSGTSGEAVRAIWEALYGIHGMKVDTGDAIQYGAHPPHALPRFRPDGEILPPQHTAGPGGGG